MLAAIKLEVEHIIEKDPAARSWLEVVLCYPGLYAVLVHRLSHRLWLSNIEPVRLLSRLLSQLTRFATGIEIHPGACLGQRIFIDHGASVVIGETAVVGSNVVLHHSVTLGARSQAHQGPQIRGKKRHPTLEDNVIVGSGGQVLGDITVGKNSQIASGSIVVRDVPPNSIVVGVPGRVIRRDGMLVADEPLPDIEAKAIKCLRDRLLMLEKQLARMNMTHAGQVVPDTSKQNPANTDSLDAVEVLVCGAGI